MNPRNKGGLKVFNGLCPCLVYVLCFFPSSAAWAQDSDAFRWSVTPYLWATETKVDLAFRDEELGGGQISFKDLLDVLDSSFMVQVEGGRGHWSGFMDLTYLETSQTQERQVFTIDTDSEQIFLDAAVAYWPGGIESGLSVYGGLRYSSFDDRYHFHLGDETVAERRSSADYYDALIGARYRFDLSERWSLVTRADASFGDSEGTWLMSANFAYTVGSRRQNRLMFGYQYKEAEFRDGDLRTDFRYQGPTAGFNFRW
jgi:hypothetical protein